MSETSCSLCRPYPLLSMRLCFSITKCTDLCRACRNRHGDQPPPVVFCLLVAFLFSQSQVGDAWVYTVGTYRSHSLGLQKLLKPTLRDSKTLKVLYINVTETAEEAGARGRKTKAGCRAKAQGRCLVKDLEIRFSILETRR